MEPDDFSLGQKIVQDELHQLVGEYNDSLNKSLVLKENIFRMNFDSFKKKFAKDLALLAEGCRNIDLAKSPTKQQPTASQTPHPRADSASDNQITAQDKNESDT